MVMPLMPLAGVAARMAAKKLAEKGGKKGAKKVSKRGNRDVERDILDANLIGLSAAKAGLAGSTLLGQNDQQEKAKEKTENKEREAKDEAKRETRGMKKGGMVKSSASKRADGIAMKGKTKGRIV